MSLTEGTQAPHRSWRTPSPKRLLCSTSSACLLMFPRPCPSTEEHIKQMTVALVTQSCPRTPPWRWVGCGGKGTKVRYKRELNVWGQLLGAIDKDVNQSCCRP
jgi:hypothetical protein